jgi:hypothetical protein
MLPFLKKNQSGSISTPAKVISRKPDETSDAPESDGIEYCAQDLIDAIHSHDKAAVAKALRDAFEILESSPHEEAPHESEKE